MLTDPEGVMSPVSNGFHHVAFYTQNGIGHPDYYRYYGAQSLQLMLTAYSLSVYA